MVKYKVKEGEALRNTENLRKELTPLSSVACGAPLPMEGGSGTTPCSTGDTKGNPVTLTLYSSPPKAAIPPPSAR